jgi:peptidoglycan/LPS O-acetylase OafA/YrhL
MHSTDAIDSRADRPGPPGDHGFKPEIQGLRALSVLAVIAAHADLPGLAGGFIGVDVFFVISGFLITRLLLAEFDRTGRIDLLAFWARRARRLLPNAFAALLGTLLLALLLFPVHNPTALVQEITYAALEMVNWHFADRAVDYFQSENPASPVLHFWSLAVEEQFYLLWPMVLVAAGLAFRGSFRRAVIALLILIWCASFTASVVLTFTEQPVAYFSTGTRVWQLATGALLAFGWPGVQQLAAGLRVPAAYLGLAAILLGVAVIKGGSSYPGLWALLPTLGTAAILGGFGAAQPQGILRGMLSLPAMQWIGARSYSWYLWHWPLLALPRMAYPEYAAIEVIAVPTSLLIACAAYAWIEMPLRQGDALRAPALTTLAGAAAGLGVVVLGAHLYWPAQTVLFPAIAARITQVDQAFRSRNQAEKDKCHLSARSRLQPDCRYGDPAASRRAVLFGDSHATHWFGPLDAAAKQAGWQLHSWTKSTCPSADVRVLRKGLPHPTCRAWYEEMMARLIGVDRPDLVIMSNSTHYPQSILDSSGQHLTGKQAEGALHEGYRSTMARLLAAGVEVAVIRDIPTAKPHFRSCYVAGGDCVSPQSQALSAPDLGANAGREFARGVRIIDLTDELCRNGECPITRNGRLIYRDSSHLATTYSPALAPTLVPHLQAIAARLAKPEASQRAAEGRAP